MLLLTVFVTPFETSRTQIIPGTHYFKVMFNVHSPNTRQHSFRPSLYMSVAYLGQIISNEGLTTSNVARLYHSSTSLTEFLFIDYWMSTLILIVSSHQQRCPGGIDLNGQVVNGTEFATSVCFVAVFLFCSQRQ